MRSGVSASNFTTDVPSPSGLVNSTPAYSKVQSEVEPLSPIVSPTVSKKSQFGSVTWYSWVVLSLLFLLRVSMNWQRKSISYLYGFQGSGWKQGDSTFEILKAYPQMDQYYGILSGAAYTLPFSFGGIVLGLMKTGYNRKTLLAGVVALGGLSQILTGLIDSFPLLCLMRSVHGFCFSMTIPLLATVVRDYFPRERRGTANSLLYSANYFGTALSSIGILLVSSQGWRQTYTIMGLCGILTAGITNLVARDRKLDLWTDGNKVHVPLTHQELHDSVPEENNQSWLKKLASSFSDVVKNPTTRYITCAGVMRHFSDAIIASFLPVFFLRTYPNFKTQYSVLNAIILTGCGFTGNLLSGLIGDTYESSNPMTKGWITTLSCALSVPLICLACAPHGNFYVSIASIAAYVLVSGGYHSTAVTMIENSVSSQQTDKMVSSWQMYTNIAQTCSPILFGSLGAMLSISRNASLYGPMIIAFVATGYIPAAILFYFGGKMYAKDLKRAE